MCKGPGHCGRQQLAPIFMTGNYVSRRVRGVYTSVLAPVAVRGTNKVSEN